MFFCVNHPFQAIRSRKKTFKKCQFFFEKREKNSFFPFTSRIRMKIFVRIREKKADPKHCFVAPPLPLKDYNHYLTRSGNWESIWRVRPANPVFYLAFSSDGTLFATAGRNDRLVRIWYKNQLMLVPSQTIETDKAKENYGFIYVAHPRSVTGFSWRDTSKYMPRL